MQWLINRNDARFKGGFATHWLNDPPFLLGIGVMQSSVLTWPYYWFPASVLETTPKEDPSGFAVYTILVRVFLCAFATAVTSKLMTRNAERQARLVQAGIPVWHDCKKGSTKPITVVWLGDLTLDVFSRSLPFAFAWLFTQLFYEIYFHAFFHCEAPYYPKDCGDSTLMMWITYSALFSFVAFQFVPKLRASSGMLAKLDKFYADALLKGDKNVMKRENTRHTLMDNMFGIGAGWAYTKMVDSECRHSLTPTCPKESVEANPEKTLYYFVTVLIILGLVGSLYHYIMRSFRLRSRATKVEAIEDGDASMLFHEMDKDGDGVVTLEELKQFITDSGLDSDIFVVAFHNLDCTDEERDGKVSTTALLAEFTRIITEMKAGANLRAVTNAQAAEYHQEIDADGDGMVSLDELMGFNIEIQENPIGAEDN